MDFSKFNYELGKAFSQSVLSTLGSQVNFDGKLAGQGFHLLASFSRNRFRLSEESVNTCLLSVLGAKLTFSSQSSLKIKFLSLCKYSKCGFHGH